MGARRLRYCDVSDPGAPAGTAQLERLGHQRLGGNRRLRVKPRAELAGVEDRHHLVFPSWATLASTERVFRDRAGRRPRPCAPSHTRVRWRSGAAAKRPRFAMRGALASASRAAVARSREGGLTASRSSRATATSVCGVRCASRRQASTDVLGEFREARPVGRLQLQRAGNDERDCGVQDHSGPPGSGSWASLADPLPHGAAQQRPTELQRRGRRLRPGSAARSGTSSRGSDGARWPRV